jgi:glycosyltransferase involved in cell wall biosynthesis
VKDELLPVLYSGAAGFAYPSVYEGFGLPPLEAMACGCPVALSDIPAHREVGGGTVLYFNPLSVEDLSHKLECLLRLDAQARASLIDEGLHRASSYRWETAAAATWRILETAM